MPKRNLGIKKLKSRSTILFDNELLDPHTKLKELTEKHRDNIVLEIDLNYYSSKKSESKLNFS